MSPTRKDKLFRYEKIVQHLEDLILQGGLEPGDKIPSIRQMKDKLGASVVTLQHAYGILENKGLIEARPQSGYYVRYRYQDLLPEPEIVQQSTVAQKLDINKLVAAYFDVATGNPDAFLALGTAAPDPAILPAKALGRTVRAASKNIDPVGLRYDFPPGHKELRRQLAVRSIDYGCNFLPDDIVTTTGALEGFNICLKTVAKPGDTIAIESPTYFGILQTLEHLGLKALEIPTHPRTGVDLKALEKAFKTKNIKACLFVPNFNNPLGSLMPDENKSKLMGLLEKYNVPLIEDDVYGDVYFQGKRPIPVKAFDKKGLVMLCSSVTKTLAPGFRVGWIIPGRYKEAVAHMKFMTSVASATLPQMTVAHFMKTGAYEKHLREYRRVLSANSKKMAEAITKYFPAGTRMTRPEGGIVTWVELPEGTDSVKLHQQALIKNILISPGIIFSAQAQYRNFIRLNYASPWNTKMESALKEVGKLCAVAKS